MKVADLRKMLKDAGSEELIKIISELYRHIPKALKENDDEGIDQIIQKILSQKREVQSSGKKNKEEKNTFKFEELENEIETFISNANNNYYIAPNRVVAKSKRSKWRFEVMRFIKQLKSIDYKSAYYDESTRLLIELFELLSYGCGIYVFRSDDPFASIGLSQYNFYKLICEREFIKDFNDVRIDKLLKLATDSVLDRQNLNYFMISKLCENLVDENDIEETLETAINRYNKTKSTPVVRTPFGNEDYTHRNHLEHQIEAVMCLYFLQHKYDEGCKFYWDEMIRNKINGRNQEITFYCLLDRLSFFGGDDLLWTEMYKKYSKGITPRERLKELYKEKMKSLK